MKVRKKPVTVEAMEFTIENKEQVLSWIEEYPAYQHTINEEHFIKIGTLEGVMTASLGDYIIKGVEGELYPCKPDIFHKTYDILDEVTE